MAVKPSAPQTISYRPGEFLFREGQVSDSILILKKGTASIRKTKGADFIELSRVYANEVLGELSFFDRQPRSASALALTDVEAIEIKFEAMDKIYTAMPEYVRTIIAAMASRLRKANDTIRKLQRDVIKEEEIPANDDGGLSATEALAAADKKASDHDDGDASS